MFCYFIWAWSPRLLINLFFVAIDWNWFSFVVLVFFLNSSCQSDKFVCHPLYGRRTWQQQALRNSHRSLSTNRWRSLKLANGIWPTWWGKTQRHSHKRILMWVTILFYSDLFYALFSLNYYFMYVFMTIFYFSRTISILSSTNKTCNKSIDTAVAYIWIFGLLLDTHTHTHTLFFLWFMGTLHKKQIKKNKHGFWFLYRTNCILYCSTPTKPLNLSAILNKKQNKMYSVWFIRLLNYRDTESFLINHLQAVITM